jgi:hypothetical protein
MGRLCQKANNAHSCAVCLEIRNIVSALYQTIIIHQTNLQPNRLRLLLLRSDMGTGKPVIMWSWVRSGMGTGSGLLYLGNTVPFSTVSWVCTTKLPVTSKLHNPDHHHHSTPNHRREQLLAGWKQGVRTASKQPQLPQHGPNDMNRRLGL